MSYTVNDACQDVGLRGIKELSRISGVSTNTLRNRFNSPKKRKEFDCLLEGAVIIKRRMSHTKT